MRVKKRTCASRVSPKKLFARNHRPRHVETLHVTSLHGAGKGFILEIILIAVLVIGVIAFVAYPLFNTPRAEISDTPNALESLVAQRDSTYDAIRDLDFDFQMGKLSQSDHDSLREKSKARAAQILKQIDELGGNGSHGETEAQIEAQVAQLRKAKTDDIEAQVAQLRRAKTNDIEAEVARVRAARSRPAGLRCAQCGMSYQAGDQFCAKCGNKL